MNAASTANTPSTVPSATFHELCTHLRISGSPLTVTDAINCAIKQWIDAERTVKMPIRGYQWKELFLPHATRVRMQFSGRWSYADVMDDDLIYQGRRVSPRQMTIAITGNGRNAWRDLWIRLPGEKHWTCAERLRSALPSAAQAAPPSPMQAMQAAASSMSQALQTALALVDHVKYQTEQAVERRLPKHRRREDFMLDDCRAD